MRCVELSNCFLLKPLVHGCNVNLANTPSTPLHCMVRFYKILEVLLWQQTDAATFPISKGDLLSC